MLENESWFIVNITNALRVLVHRNARALLIDPIELPNHGVVACGWA